MEELTPEEWKRVEDASWAGGARAWKAVINEILTERLDAERDRIVAEFLKAEADPTSDIFQAYLGTLETVTHYRQRHAEGIQGAEPDLTVIDESYLWTREDPVPTELARIARVPGLGTKSGLDLDAFQRAVERGLPTCLTCGKPLTSVSEEIVPKVRRLCAPAADDREDGKRYRRYEPCGHVIEVDEADDA